MPVNFASSGALSVGALPIDPTNTTSTDLFYTYTPGGSWALTAGVESSKYQAIALGVSQNINDRYQLWTNTSLVATTVYGGATEPELIDAPTVVTSVASDTAYGYSAVTANGTVNPNGNATTYWFEYGTTLSYGSSTSPQSAGSGSEAVAAQASLTGLSGGTQYYVRLVAQNDGGTTNGSAVSFYTDVNTSLVAHWKMDNSWASAVGSYTGTGYGGIGFTTGQINQAGVFDGSDNYVQIAHSSNLNPGTGDMTIMFWGKRDAGTKKGGLTKISGDMTWPQGESTTGYGLLMNSDDAVVFTISNNTSNYRKSAATSALSDAGWHHIVATWDYSEQQVVIYVDGVASNNSNSTAGTVTSIGYTHATRFGCLSTNYCSSNNILDGYMDDARYYNRELSSDEVLAIYEATR